MSDEPDTIPEGAIPAGPTIASARYASAAHDAVLATYADGSLWAYAVDDPALEGIEIADFQAEPEVSAAVTRAQALDVMAGHILPDGRALDTAMEEDLQAALDATASLPDGDANRMTAKRAAIWFRNAGSFERRNPYLLDAQGRYGLSDADVDQLFRDAAARTA